MSCYVYCLYSTEDGNPRYVGKASDKVSYRFKQHITAALDNEKGSLYDWIRNVWRTDHDIAFHTLQENIIPKDLDMFEKYWIDQFSDLLNVAGNGHPQEDSKVGKEVRAALKNQIQQTRKA